MQDQRFAAWSNMPEAPELDLSLVVAACNEKERIAPTVTAFPYSQTTGRPGVLRQAGFQGCAPVLRIGELDGLIRVQRNTGGCFERGDIADLARHNDAAWAGQAIDEAADWYPIQAGRRLHGEGRRPVAVDAVTELT